MAAFEAERTRFELVVQNNPYGSLANCWFQPLTHLSGELGPKRPSKTDGTAKIPLFCQLARLAAKKLFVLQLYHLQVFAHQTTHAALGIGYKQEQLGAVGKNGSQAHAFVIGQVQGVGVKT